ncbi:MAG: UDP-N-acetylmuramoyl-tripeptide--D-alanyl-D-alanine ligase [Deltaproteobacteria bacterium]|nr:MAG: UDP-N-acetylmuramoyl-tripeptide--D-alanyl-D-alanine ligase [Deltaproteobacteria bacterium]
MRAAAARREGGLSMSGPRQQAPVLATAEQVARAVSGRLVSGRPDAACSGVSSDSRTITPGQLFVALRGEHFDGASFCAQAVSRGASLVLLERRSWNERLAGQLAGAAVVLVPDSLRALGDLAAWQRRRFDLPVVGVTGSNGKTTTKQMVTAVLGGAPAVLANPGNLNNLIGLPLTLLRLASGHRRVVLEMGMNVPGEIARLAEIAAPQVGVVTNVHPVHLEGLGSIEAIAAAKAELVEALPAGGTAVLNADDPLVWKMRERTRAGCLTFGKVTNADVRIDQVSTAAGQSLVTLELAGRELQLRLQRPGAHNAYNAAAAAAVGLAQGLAAAEIATRLEAVEWPALRMELVAAASGQLLVDCYNANPRSVQAALQTLRQQAAGKPTAALLGDMLELGSDSPLLHRQVGQAAARQGVQWLCAFGPLMVEGAAAARQAGMNQVQHCQEVEEAAAWLSDRLRQGCWVLVKGSRGMRLERVVEHACRQLGVAWPGKE